tara:strand:- start:607 stop:876 length:270 start_codon:yes stop_codon:yes gene_type:complete
MSNEIYTDKDQCHRFNVSYFDREATLIINADELLASKCYDRRHREILEPYGPAKIVLKRAPDHGPGWWAIVPDEDLWTPAKSIHCEPLL